MISERHAIAQINRLSSLSGGKSISKGGMAEYLRVIKATAKSDFQVAGAITNWIDSQTFPPSPAELRVIIEATPVAIPASDADCKECSGSGRRSFWALIYTERWPDSGNIRRRKVEEIPVTGDPNLWLLSWPPLASQVDGNDQQVEMLNGFCRCVHGQRRKTLAQGAPQ